MGLQVIEGFSVCFLLRIRRHRQYKQAAVTGRSFSLQGEFGDKNRESVIKRGIYHRIVWPRPLFVLYSN